MTRLYRYIRLPQMGAAMRAGWLATSALKGCHHGEYSVLCEWLCACPEAWPLEGK